MAFDCEVDALRDRVDGALQRRVIEGDHRAALVADEVMVVVVRANRLVTRLRLAEFDLRYNAQLVELLKDSVDAGAANGALTLREQIFDLVGAKRAALLVEQ